MKTIHSCLTLFCTTITAILPTMAAQTLDLDYPQEPSLIQNQRLYNHAASSLLEDLSMLEEFDEQNRQAEQLLKTKLDEEEEVPHLQQALDESRVYAQSLESYDAERPQRIEAMKEKLAKSTQDRIIEFRRQLSDIDAKVRTLAQEVIEKGEKNDPTWDLVVDSYIAALKQQEEERASLLPAIEEQTKFLAVLTRKWDAPGSERVGIPSPEIATISSPNVIPVPTASSLPVLHSSALPPLPFSSGGSSSSSANQ